MKTPDPINLDDFRLAVDASPDHVTPISGDLNALYRYAGLPIGSALLRSAVGDEFYAQIGRAFASGHQIAWRRCRELREELIQSHVLDGKPLDPYFSVLDNLEEALRSAPQIAGDIQGNWVEAIRHAHDNVRLNDWSASPVRERLHAREFEVARAAKRVRDRGYALDRSGHLLMVEAASEVRLVGRLEQLTKDIGGLNVTRRIFAQLAPLYDSVQERYHLVQPPSHTGGGHPHVPFGYLLLLACKHLLGEKSAKNADRDWDELIALARDYAAVIDVQEYAPGAFRSFDAHTLVPFLQALALHDTLFRIPQLRGSDVEKMARGILSDCDFAKKRGTGWTINEVLEIGAALLEASRHPPGPHRFTLSGLSTACPNIQRATIAAVLEDVLCHPGSGANQNFSKPTDAPGKSRGEPDVGHNSYYRPLFSRDRKAFWLAERAVGGIGCLEALLTQLRKDEKNLDGQLGTSIEKFLHAEFAVHQIPSLTGRYIVGGEHGECDIVIETQKTIIFLEIKKKPWTRRAQAGSDADVLIDLANSLLAAQVQAGWHEVRLRKHGFIDLDVASTTSRLSQPIRLSILTA